MTGLGTQICNLRLMSTELTPLLGRHKVVFHNELGSLRGMKAKIHMKPNIAPSVPYMLKGAIERGLERLQREGMIDPVIFSE